MDPIGSDERRPDPGRLGAGWRWLLKLRVLRQWGFNLRIIDWLFLAVGFGVFAGTTLAVVALIYLLAAIGGADSTMAVFPLGAGVAVVLSVLAMVLVWRRLPPPVLAILDEEDEGVDEFEDDATPAVFGVSDPEADPDRVAERLAGTDAALAPPPDESQPSGPR